MNTSEMGFKKIRELSAVMVALRMEYMGLQGKRKSHRLSYDEEVYEDDLMIAIEAVRIQFIQAVSEFVNNK